MRSGQLNLDLDKVLVVVVVVSNLSLFLSIAFSLVLRVWKGSLERTKDAKVS